MFAVGLHCSEGRWQEKKDQWLFELGTYALLQSFSHMSYYWSQILHLPLPYAPVTVCHSLQPLRACAWRLVLCGDMEVGTAGDWRVELAHEPVVDGASCLYLIVLVHVFVSRWNLVMVTVGLHCSEGRWREKKDQWPSSNSGPTLFCRVSATRAIDPCHQFLIPLSFLYLKFSSFAVRTCLLTFKVLCIYFHMVLLWQHILKMFLHQCKGGNETSVVLA